MGLTCDFATYSQFMECIENIPFPCLNSWAAKIPAEKLVLASETGYTVAHELARCNALPKSAMTRDILTLSNIHGKTVAHILAEINALPDSVLSPELLSLRTDTGETVLVFLVFNRNIPYEHLTPELAETIVNPRSGSGTRVLDICLKWFQEPMVSKKDPAELEATLRRLPFDTLLLFRKNSTQTKRLSGWGNNFFCMVNSLIEEQAMRRVTEDISEHGFGDSECENLYGYTGERD